MRKTVWAGTREPSFAAAAEALEELAEAELSAKQVRRITTVIGQDRVAERRAEVDAFKAKTLMQRTTAKPDVEAPDVGVVMLDNGTHQRRDNFGDPTAKTHWKQETGGLVLSMTSELHQQDPSPEFPEWLFGCEVVSEIANLAHRQEIPVDQREKAAGDADKDSDKDDSTLEPKGKPGFEWTPTIVSREVIASTEGPEVGHHLEWLAHERGVSSAKRQAFVGDGAPGIWAIHQKHFSQMTPIVDLMHVLSYAYRAAQGIGESGLYRRWAVAIWQGRVREVLAELGTHQERLGAAPEGASADDPRQRLQRALTYYTNNQSRMNYPKYRRLGLPITSSLMESTIKQLSRRVKGTEKFWNHPTADALLQLRADQLSDSKPLDSFWTRWHQKITGSNRYRAKV